MCVVAQTVWAVFALHKNNLPTDCSTKTDVCVCVVSQAVVAVFAVHKDKLPISAQPGLLCVCGCPGSLDRLCYPHENYLLSGQQGLICVWLLRQSGQSLLSTRTIYLLKCSTRTDVCVWLSRQSGQSLLSTRTIYLLSAQQGLMCVWLPRQSGQSLLSTRTIYLLSAQQGLMCVCVCGCPGSLGSLCCP